MKNKKGFLIILTVFMVVMFNSFELGASIEFKVDFSSRFIWRGFDNESPSKPVIQPSLTYQVEKTGLFLCLWESISFESTERLETDIALWYNFKTGENVALSVGITHYGWYFRENFTFKDSTTHELYASLGLLKLPFSPKFTVYYDFHNATGLYFLLEGSHSIELSKNKEKKTSLDIMGGLGYNHRLYIGGSGFSDVWFGVTVPIEVGKVTISPFIKTSFILLDEVNPGVNNETWFGVSLLTTF